MNLLHILVEYDAIDVDILVDMNWWILLKLWYNLISELLS